MPKNQNELQPIYSSPADIGNSTNQAMVDGISSQFPITQGRYTLNLKDPFVDTKEFSHQDEKDAILSSKSLTYPIRGTLQLVDNETGKVVDEARKFNLANTYHITNKHTILYNGNNYSVSNLIQLRPGVYTRRKDNNDIEAQFNTGKGVNFNLGLNPVTEVISINKVNKNKVNIPIAPILTKVFGLSDSEITKFIPADVWLTNKKATAGKDERFITALYSRMVSTVEQKKDAPIAEKMTALRSRIEEHGLDKVTTAITLGKPFETVEAEALLRAIRNLIQLHKRERPEDNRDSLEFKRVQNLPDYIRRRFDPAKPSTALKTAQRDISRRVAAASTANKDGTGQAPRIRDILRAKPFDRVFSEFITQSDLTSTPDETNPIESLENVGKTTVIAGGEGGVKDEHSAPPEARNVHASHLGILDPSRTPESSRAGLDQRFTITARRDKDGTMYSRMEDKTGKIVYLSANELMSSIVGFPGQRKTKHAGDKVQAQDRGEFRNVPYETVQYWVPNATDMYTITTNLVPFLNSNHPGRLTMAGKAIPQALSLTHREVPLVQTMDHAGNPFVKTLGGVISTVSPITGTVVRATPENITIQDAEGNSKRVDLVDNLPFNMKGFHNDEPHKFKVGDHVDAGQIIADNNYTKDGKLALGVNLHAAYMPYKGYNHEDGIVVSQSAASKLTSSHAYKFDYTFTPATEDSLAKFKTKFPSKFTPDQVKGLDEHGFPKKGTKLHYGDAIFAVLEKKEASETDKVLGRLHKTLVNPYRAKVEIWNHEEDGVVTDVYRGSKEVKIMVRSEKQLETGDKITGFHGNKGVVSAILDDDEMPHSRETGKPLDLLLNPASVTSRINLGQVMETAAAKIAQKTGNPFLLSHYDTENNAESLKKKLDALGISDVDEIYDHKTGRVYGSKVLAGPQYILKLNKTTDQNYSARSVDKYDNNAQPGKGGDEGAKSVGYMEFLGLLGSDARKNLQEISTIKAEGGDLTKSTEYWQRFMKGEMLPPVQTTFATRKFFDYLKGSGIKVSQDHQNQTLKLSPMTNADILGQSKGEVKDATMLHKMKPEKGGLFDFAVTGGPEGKNWSHYSLAEPIVNPSLESPVKSMLGLNSREFDNIVTGNYGVVNHGSGVFSLVDNKSEDDEGNVNVLRRLNVNTRNGLDKMAKDEGKIDTLDHDVAVGGAAFREMLNHIDVDEEVEHLKKAVIDPKSKSKRNEMVKRLKFLYGLQSQGHKNIGDVAVIDNIPVLPPIMRPYSIQNNGVKYADVNQMYKHHIIVNNKLKQTHEDMKGYVDPNLLGVSQARKDLYDGAKAIMSNGESIEFTDRQRGVKSLMTQITGKGSPKEGFFHKMMLSRKQDFSGRGTIYADPDLGLDEARIPKDQLWTMYEMHILRELSGRGYDLADAKKAYRDKAPAAMQAFNKLIKEVPVLLNRAPTLMRTNIMAVMPVPTDGKTIGVNPLQLPAFAADYDGDAMSMHLPISRGAILEAKEKMLPSKHLHDARKGFGVPMFAPAHEAILGSVHLTKADPTKEPLRFDSEEEAMVALNSGEISDDTPIYIERR